MLRYHCMQQLNNPLLYSASLIPNGKSSRTQTEMSSFLLFAILIGIFVMIEADSEQQKPPDIYFTKEPLGQIHFSNNTGATTECLATGSTPTTVTWTFADSTPVHNITGLRTVNGDGKLAFLPFNSEAFRQDAHSVVYRCQASNNAGTIVSRDVHVKAIMDVDYDSSVYDVFAIRGNTAVIKCHIPAFLQDYVSVVAFIRDDSLKISSPPDTEGKFSLSSHGSLYIRNVGMNDAGTSYKCQTYHHLTGKMKISSTTGKLFVTDPHGNIPPRILDTTPAIQLKIGDNVLLPCIAHGYPIPESSWQRKIGLQLEKVNVADKRIKISSYGLLISNVQLSDDGVYTCQIQNLVGTDETQIVLNVNAALKVSVNPQHQRVNIGSAFELKCNVTGSPIRSVLWTKNGVPINTPHANKGDLYYIQVSPTRLEDKGIYQCFANNEIETVQGIAEVELGEFPPMFHETFHGEELQPGSPIALTCRATGNPTPKIEWTLDTIPIQGNERMLIENKMTENNQIVSTLSVRKAIAEDGGVYSCKATNDIGSVHYSSRISIFGPLIARKIPKISFVSGSTAQLNCPIYGHPIGKIQWEKDELTLPISIRQGLMKNWTLLIQDIQRNEDTGEYKCTASNQLGQSATNIIQVAVLVLPKITPFAFQDELLREGMRARIQCVISEGDSPVTIQWTKDGQPVSKDNDGISVQQLDEFSSILAIRTVTPRQNGNYTCMAKNPAGSTTHTAALFVNAPPKIIPFAFQDDQNFKGMRAHIICAVSQGDLPLAFQWLKDGQKIDHALGATLGSYDRHSSSLSIENVISKHSGNYTCVVTNEAGMASFTAQLMVQVAPKIVPFTFQGDHLFEGVLARISCVVYQGDLPLSIIWEKDGEPINAHDGITIHTVDDFTSILTIDHVLKKHSGNYSCIAKNSAEAVSHTARLLVKVPPKIVPFSFQDEELVEGMFVRVSCVVSRGDLPLSISWTKDKRPIPSELGVVVRQMDDYTSVLSIDHITILHSGNYSCTAKNLAALASFTSLLIVHVPPRWEIAPEPKQDAVIGSRVVMHCKADGYPQPSITWMAKKDSLHSTPMEPLKVTGERYVLPNGSYVIENVETGDESLYFCIAKNGIGKGLSRSMYLHIKVPPIIISTSKNQTTKIGNKLTLYCSARGDSPINGSWLIKEKSLTINNQMRSKQYEGANNFTTELTILKASQSDDALFTCQFQNIYGKNQTSVSVIVQGRPQPPQDVNAVAQGEKTVQVSWKPPAFDGHSPITKYIIEYSTIKSGKLIHATTTTTTEKVTLTELQPASTYKLSVFAENVIGKSENDAKTEITLLGQAPSGEPENVQAQAQNGKSLRVSWQPPAPHTWNGNILGYFVGYRLTESDDPYEYLLLEVPEGYNKGLSYTISDLKEFTSYSIVVQAFNDYGKGPLSDEVLAMTSEGVPNKAPSALQCTSTSAQTIIVDWQPPPQTSIQGILRGYRVLYWTSEMLDDEALISIFNTTETKVTLRGLFKYANYSIQVLAYTLVGDGVASKPIFCATLEDLPSAPADIKAIPASSTSILLTWLPPTLPNGIVTYYTLFVEDTISKKEDKMHIPKGKGTVHEVHKLKTTHEYKFRVSAATSIGDGPSTPTITASPAIGTKSPARIVAFSRTIKHSANSPLILSCDFIGFPTPKRSWFFRNHPIVNDNRISVHPDGTLQITSLHLIDSGNFTCQAANDLGQDHVTYNVVVKSHPNSPALAVSSTSFTAIDLQWNLPTKKQHPVLGYTLHYKQELGPWTSIDLQPYLNSFQLGNLQCGTVYQMYLTAYNDVGNGQPSNTLTVTTTGGAPLVPTLERLVEEKSAHAILHLDTWTSNGCPILYFVVEYKPKLSKSWQLVSDNLRPDKQTMILEHLQPASWYSLRMTAHTTAGSAVAEYDFSTLTVDGAMGDDEGSLSPPSFLSFLDVNMMMSIGACVVVILLCFTVTCFWVSRKKNTGRKSPSAARKKKGKGKKCSAKRSSHASVGLNNEDSDDEISPYAMVKLSDFQSEKVQPVSDHHRPSTSGTPLRQFASHNYNPTAPPMSESYSPFAKGAVPDGHPRKYPALPVYAMPKKEMMRALRDAPTEGTIENDPDVIPPPEETIFVFPPPPPAAAPDEQEGDYDPPPPELDWLPGK